MNPCPCSHAQELAGARSEHAGERAALQASQQQLAAQLASTKEQLEGHIADLTDEVRPGACGRQRNRPALRVQPQQPPLPWSLDCWLMRRRLPIRQAQPSSRLPAEVPHV